MSDAGSGSVSEELRDVRVVQPVSSLLFLLPLFVTNGSYRSRADRAIRATVPGRSTPFWKPCAFQWAQLLPHVRKYLYSDCAERGDGSTATLLTATPEAVEWFGGPSDAADTWEVDLPGGRTIGLVIIGAHLFCFYSDFVMVGVEVAATTSAASNWFDLLYHGRFFTDRACPVRIRTRAMPDVKRAIRFLADSSGAAIERDGGSMALMLPSLKSVLDVLLDTASIPTGGDTVSPGVAEQPGVPGQTLAYSVLVFEGDAAMAAGRHLVNRARGAHPASVRTVSFETLDVDEGILAYQEYSWFIVSDEGGGFVAVRPDWATLSLFDRVELPSQARTDYLFVFAFCAFQRFTMIRLSDRIVRYSLEHEEEFSDLQQRMLEFASRGVFAQISQNQHHHHYYRTAQAVNQISAIHNELRQEVDAIREYQQAADRERHERRSRAIEVMFGVVTGVIIPMQLVAALFPTTVSEWPVLKGIAPGDQELGSAVFVVALVVVTTTLLLHAGRDRHR